MARIDPKGWAERRGRTGTLPPADLSTATLGTIALELAPLRALAGAQCVAEAVGALAADARAGQSASTLPELRRWVARWSRLRSDLRAFYEELEVQTSEAGNWGLRRILTGQGTASGPLRGALDKLWIDRHGVKAPFSLIPKVEL